MHLVIVVILEFLKFDSSHSVSLYVMSQGKEMNCQSTKTVCGTELMKIPIFP